MKCQRRQFRTVSRPGEDRRGTVLVVVMGLMGLLMFLGFAFYTFTRQEEGNAEYFNAAARRVDDPGLSPDLLFDFAARQVIMGARAEEENSAFWGGRHTLLGGMFGHDLAPYSSSGINVIPDTNAGLNQIPFGVDQDYNGQPDGSVSLFEFNDSPAANSGTGRDLSGGTVPAPDTDYTYPDLNNIFLAYNGYGAMLGNQPVRVIIPSFHRPQYMREVEEFIGTAPNVVPISRPIGNWWSDATTATRVMRPHTAHQHIQNGSAIGARYGAGFPMAPDDGSNGVVGKPLEQGIWDIAPWKSGYAYKTGELVVPRDPNERILLGRYNRVYQCTAAGTSDAVEPTWRDTTTGAPNGTVTDGSSVIWTAVNLATTQPFYEYDADADGDGIREAVWLDLDFPVQTMNDGTGRKFIPMFAITIYDADGLLNLLSHGNIEGSPAYRNGSGNFRDGSAFGGGTMLHQSNLGITPFEINPQYAFNADTTSDLNDPSDLQQLEDLFQRTASSMSVIELSNMEWFTSRVGRVQFQRRNSTPTPTNLFPGIYGEEQQLLNVVKGLPATPPSPGRYNADDNQNRNAGEDNGSFSGFGSRERSYGHPLDFRGIGRAYDISGALPGKTVQTLVNGANSPNRYLQYVDYPSRGTVTWGDYNPFGTKNLMVNASGTPIEGLAPPSDYPLHRNPLLDEPYELLVDHDNPSANDAIFSIGESLFLQGSNSDIDALGLNFRTRSLMEYNLWTNKRAQEIRRRLTTHTADLKTFSVPMHRYNPTGTPNRGPLRQWEFTDNNGGDVDTATFTFPPTFTGAGADPFRPALRTALTQQENDRNTSNLGIRRTRQRTLNLNGVTVLDNQGLATSRDLTEYPQDPGTAPVGTLTTATWQAGRPATFGSAAQQTQWARMDRQKMARDIYVMLYMFGGGRDVEVVGGNGQPLNYMRGAYNPTAMTYSNDIDTARGGTPAGIKNAREDVDGDGQAAGDADDDYYRLLYDDDQLREMAQFAINVVGQLDRDDIIDVFEYDKDLSDGWNLDDDPYDAGTGTAADDVNDAGLVDPVDRGVVYSVEQQGFVFSEALAVRAEEVLDGSMQPTDLKATEWSDDKRRYWTFIELRNAAPYQEPVRRSWQIVMDVLPTGSTIPSDTRTLTLENSATVSAGGTLLIASEGDELPTAAGVSNKTSAIRIDLDYDEAMAPDNDGDGNPDPPSPANFEMIAPAATNASHFNLMATTSTNLYDLRSTVAGSSLTELLDESNVGGAPGTPLPTLKFTLRQRVHRTRGFDANVDPTDENDVNNEDNPWVTVDVMTVTPGNGFARLKLESTDKNGWDIKEELANGSRLRSWERRERLSRQSPSSEQLWKNGQINLDDLDGTPGNEIDGDSTTFKTVPNHLFTMNSLSQQNSVTNNSLWQWQVNRDLASVSELLNVPLYGPDEVTLKTDRMGRFTAGVQKFLNPIYPSASWGSDGFPGIQGQDDNNDGVIDDLDERGWSGSDDPQNVSDPYLEAIGQAGAVVPNSTKFDNRWYRLLEFWELPTLVNGYTDPYGIVQPGMMNLNGIRYPASLAGLVDDSYAFNNFIPVKNSQSQPTVGGLGVVMPDGDGETNRDWWFQFLLSRDQIDPLTGMVLPGTASSRPFRSLSYTADGGLSLQDTVLRQLPVGAGATPGVSADPNSGIAGLPRRHLFELQSRGEFQDNNSNNKPDYIGRNRLLSKILNNTTTRSNVFFMFAQVEFFEVFESTGTGGTTLQQVGGLLPESPGHRAFFVIDRSKAFDLLKTNDFDDWSSAPAIYSLNDTFPYQRLIRYQQTLE